jgi:hypothetical protein
MSLLLLWITAVATNEGCPEYTIIEELQTEYMLGTWYEMYSLGPHHQDPTMSDDLDCGQIDFDIGAPAFHLNSTYRHPDGTF